MALDTRVNSPNWTRDRVLSTHLTKYPVHVFNILGILDGDRPEKYPINRILFYTQL